MTEVHRYSVVKMLSEGGNRISYDPHGPEVVMASAYDQLKAENESLHSLLREMRSIGNHAPAELTLRVDAALGKGD